MRAPTAPAKLPGDVPQLPVLLLSLSLLASAVPVEAADLAKDSPAILKGDGANSTTGEGTPARSPPTKGDPGSIPSQSLQQRTSAGAGHPGWSMVGLHYPDHGAVWGRPWSWQQQPPLPMRWPFGPQVRSLPLVQPRSPQAWEFQVPIWSSGWFPASHLDMKALESPLPPSFPQSAAQLQMPEPPQGVRGLARQRRPQGVPAGSDQARELTARFFPQVFRRPSQSNQYPGPSSPAGTDYWGYNSMPTVGVQPGELESSPLYGGIGTYYGDKSDNPPPMEIVSPCERTVCYMGCRLSLLGGGRCTRGGCLCYAAFFDRHGSPLSIVHPEDRIWYELNTAQRYQILQAMANKVPSPPATPPPPGQGSPPQSSRPAYPGTHVSGGPDHSAQAPSRPDHGAQAHSRPDQGAPPPSRPEYGGSPSSRPGSEGAATPSRPQAGRPKAPPEELLGLDDNRGDYTFDDTYDEDEEDDQAFFSD